MKTSILLTTTFIILLLAISSWAQSTTFTYQGKLTDSSLPASGIYDFQFILVGGSPLGQVGPTLVRPGTTVTNGVFTVQLDFSTGNNNPLVLGNGVLLRIGVKRPADAGFTTLTPDEPITSAPYAMRSVAALSADSLSTECVLCVTDAHIQSLDGGKVTGTVGSALVASTVTGVVSIANGGTGSTAKNFVDLTSDQSNISGNKAFNGAVSVTGGGGVFSGNGSGLTNLNGASIVGGTVTSTQLSADALPNSNSLKLLGSKRWDLLKPQNDFAVGSFPDAITFDGTNIWVVNDNGGTVTKLRASDGVNLGTFTVTQGPGVSGVVFDGTNVWLGNLGGNQVTKLRASDGANLGTVTLGPGSAVPVAFDGTNVWVKNGVSLTKIRVSDGANMGTFAVNLGGLVFDGANMWGSDVSNPGTIIKLRASDGTIAGTFAVSAGVGVFDGTNIWLSVSNVSGSVIKLRAGDGANLGTFAVGSFPRGIAFDGENIWVVNGGSKTITKLRASDGTNLGTFPTDGGGSLAFDGTNMWVTNPNSDTVTRLPPAFPQ